MSSRRTGSTGRYNGTVKDAPKKKSTGRTTKKELAKALELEQKRSAALSTKLKKVRADKKQLEATLSLDEGGSVFGRGHSTLRDDIYSSQNDSMLLTSMSFASMNIPECRPNDGEQDIDKKSYEQWKELLEASMNLVGVTDEMMKLNIFKIKAGRKLLEIFEGTVSSPTMPDEASSSYSNAICRLDGYFGSRDYVLLQRQKLRSTLQRPDESDVCYVKRVISVAKLCEYGEEQLVENVADVLQLHALNVKVREAGRKIIRKGGSLVELMDKIRAYEIEQLNEDIFAKNHQLGNQASIAAVTHSQQPGSGTQFRSNTRFESRVRSNGLSLRGRGSFRRRGNGRNSGAQCWRCTSYYHPASDCHAIEKVCRNCNVKGHIERACQQMPGPGSFPIKRRADENEAPDSKPKRVAAVITEEADVKDAKIESVDKLDVSDVQSGIITGYIANVPVVFLIDSGAEVNTINVEVFNRLMNDEDSMKLIFHVSEGSDKPLRAYASSENIDVSATFVAELLISEDRPSFMEKFYVVANARALLSRGTAIRYSVLQIGLNVPVVGGFSSETEKLFPGEIFAVVSSTEFPKFNVPPVILSYDRTKPPSRIIFTHIPPAFKLETERRLNDLLMSGIIEQVSGEMDKSFCSSLLVVPKGKGDIRLVVDLRGPNKCIVRTPFRMPTLDEILGDLNGAQWFSTIDLTSAFFHVEIHENSRHLTNFFAGNTMYRFKRLPFGLCNAPDIFQEVVQTTILAGCKGVRNYLDDFLVHGKTKMEHDANLKNVLDRLHEHNVSINNDKCVFGQRTVTFLGYSLSHDGLRVEDEKMKAVREFRRPRSQLEVKSFLGLVNFSERFILHRAEKTVNLRNLAKAEDFYWRDEEEEEFKFLKNDALQSISKLGYFSYEDETELYVDASPVGLGAVLVQYDSGSVPRIISCASKALSETEKKYPQTQKEALAMVWGIERFSLYLRVKIYRVTTLEKSMRRGNNALAINKRQMGELLTKHKNMIMLAM